MSKVRILITVALITMLFFTFNVNIAGFAVAITANDPAPTLYGDDEFSFPTWRGGFDGTGYIPPGIIDCDETLSRPTKKAEFIDQDFKTGYANIVEQNGFLFVVGKDVGEESETKDQYIIKCLDSEKLTEKWSTVIGEGRPFVLTVDGDNLFYTDLSTGIHIFDVKFGRELARQDLYNSLEVDNSEGNYWGYLLPPVVMDGKMFSKYVLGDPEGMASEGILIYSLENFELTGKVEYDKDLDLSGIFPFIYTYQDKVYGVFDLNDGANKLLEIDADGNPKTLLGEEGKFHEGDNMCFFEEKLYLTIEDIETEIVELVCYDMETEITEKVQLDSEFSYYDAEFAVNHQYIVLVQKERVQIFNRSDLKHLNSIQNVNLIFHSNVYATNDYAYLPVSDKGNSFYLGKIDLKSGELSWLDRDIRISSRESLAFSKYGIYTFQDTVENTRPLVRYQYDEEMVSGDLSDILTEMNDSECTHKMYLQIGNKSWATNGISIEKNLDSAPMINSDRTFVEIRSILEKAGAELSWIEDERAVEITGIVGDKIKLWIGKPDAVVNGNDAKIEDGNDEVVPFIENGRTMLPLRFISESLGFFVGWNADKKIITIDYTNPLCKFGGYEFTDTEGNTHKIDDYLGKPVLLDFTASWCVWCIRALPALKALHEKYKDKVTIISVDKGEDMETAQGMVEEHEIPWTVLVDTEERLTDVFRIGGIPHFVILDSKGQKAFTKVGFSPELETEFSEEFEKLLK